MIQKKVFHPRNRHQGHYDFKKLIQNYPELASAVAKNKYGDESIDFANPVAVRTLNRALLKHYYGLAVWDIPQNYLCPPIPGRADYIHNIADLLGLSPVGSAQTGKIPRGAGIRVLDIGVGANCIYPIIGFFEYGWSFVGADIDPVSLKNAAWIIQANPGLADAIQFRQQVNSKNIFAGILGPNDHFDATLCNPPFHASLEEAQAGTHRKWKNLGKAPSAPKHEKQLVNFGGQGAELWCEGGELAFIQQMIKESALFASQCRWFTTLVSKEDSLNKIYASLKTVKAHEWKTLDMAQGQKKSRIVAWTFNRTPAS